MGNKKSHEQFVSELQEINPNVAVIGKYTKSVNRIACKCLICGREWSPKANNLLSGYGCKNCGIIKRANTQRKTTADFIAEMQKIDDTIEIIGEYLGAQKPIDCRCKKCGNTWIPLATNLISGKGCKNCSRVKAAESRKMTNIVFLKKLYEINPDIIVHNNYTGYRDDISCTCKICGITWETKPSSLLKGYGCRRCSGNERYTQDTFVAKLQKINPNIEVQGSFSDVHTPIHCKCLLCGHEWDPRPHNLLHQKGCPNCQHSTTSFFEQVIYEVLTLVMGNTEVFLHDRTTIGYELDIYIPALNIAIEPGSWRWHENKLQQDSLKRKTCEEKGIRLITIYTDYPSLIPPFESDCLIAPRTFGLASEYGELKDIITELLQLCGIRESISEQDWETIIQTAFLNSRRKSTQSFIAELAPILPNVTILGEYNGALNDIRCRCNICGSEWPSLPHNLRRGHGCKKCAAIERGKKLRKKPEKFEQELLAITPGITILTPYVDNKTKVSCRCTVCGNIWSSLPSVLLRGNGCAKCRKERKIFQE